MGKTIDPRMHSAEHILNGTMDRMFGCGRCIGAHIEKKKSKCDYAMDRPLTDAEVAAVEAAVNRVIQSDLPVTEEFLSREAAGARYRLHRLPEDAGDRIRIVSIGDYDRCPCVGPHVASTGEISGFQITSTDLTAGILRIRYKLDRPPRPA
jgi:Ser-tRNA(Ala) deacylase AlaX